ncbi:MAG: UDP-N-acetylglucosamine 2-epimerase (non-hydrolyzing) [Phycisphaerales bacterium]|nr:UDP-N-acetylglucosamine 2-epimerase (non-hydrolyzing) [Phycisphaerales bacterium]
MKQLRVMTLLGTRPEIIRLSRVMAALDTCTEHTIVHTGQNWDHELNQVFFDDLGIRQPDLHLEVDTASLGATLGDILAKTEAAIKDVRPDALLVLGDTNSALGSIMAKRLHVPVYHMEAGNRCFDANVPEEVNRKIVDHLADFNLVYSEHARRHLIAEGFPQRRIILTGSPMLEVIDAHRSAIEASDALGRFNLEPGGYLLASLHREENVDHPDDLTQLVDSLSAARTTFDRPVLLSTHPRTRNRLEALGRNLDADGIRCSPPMGFLDYCRLQMSAFCVLSDSGTITEESSIIGFPAVTLRRSMERPEGMDTGSIMLTGLDSETVVDAIAWTTNQWASGHRPPTPDAYCISNVSQRVCSLILGTAKLASEWTGVRPRQEV